MSAQIILWTAEWCGPCQSLKKKGTLEKLATHFQATLETRDVDEPEWDKASDDEDVLSMPTIDLMRDGVRVARVIGGETFEGYVKKINSQINKKEKAKTKWKK